MQRLPLFRRADAIPMVVCLVLAGVLCGMMLESSHGQRLSVRTDNGEHVYPMTQDTTFTVVGRDAITLTVVIEDGAAYVREATCPDHVCVHTGKLTRSGQSAACVPGGVVITVQGGEPPQTDAVAR